MHRCANTENFDAYMPLVGVPAELGDYADDDAATYYFATVTAQQVYA